MAFPSSPANGDTATIGDTTFTFNSARNQWKGVLTSTSSVSSGGSSSSGGTTATVSSTAPTSPAEGDLWYDQTVGKLFILVGSAWVDTSPR